MKYLIILLLPLLAFAQTVPLGSSGSSSSTSSQWTTQADGIYFVPDAADEVRIGHADGPSSGTTAQLVVSYPNTNNTIAMFRSTTGTHGAAAFITLGDIAGTVFDFSVDLQGFLSSASAVAPLNLNRQGGLVNIGSGAATIGLPGFTSCTGFTSNASDQLVCTASDERLKKNITPFARGLEALKDIKPISFQMRDPADKGVSHTGFSAQNLEKHISEAVRENADGMKHVDHWPIIATLVNANNELRERIEKLEGLRVTTKAIIPQKPIYRVPKQEKAPCMGSKAFCANQGKPK